MELRDPKGTLKKDLTKSISQKKNQSEMFVPGGIEESKELKTEELVITQDTKISEYRNPEHKKLFPLLDYVENSKISSVKDLNYFESLFSLGNMSELSKSLTANMWEEY